MSEHSNTSLKRGVNESGAVLGRLFVSAAILALLAAPTSAPACAACYGQSDSPLASGVTWGILSLLVVIMSVLGSIVSFFVYINKKSAAAAASQTAIANYPSQFTNH